MLMLAPTSSDVLIRRIRQILEREEGEPSGWTPVATIAGDLGYTAVLGSPADDGLSEYVAEELSLELPGTVYLTEEEADEPLITRFDRGQSSFSEEDPRELAASLGCELPRKSVIQIGERSYRELAVIESARPDEVQATLESQSALGASLLHFDSNRIGTVIWSESGVLDSAAADLWEARPDYTIYVISYSRDGEFVVKRLHGELSEMFRAGGTTPTPRWQKSLESILGFREPELILRALDVSRTLLGL